MTTSPPSQSTNRMLQKTKQFRAECVEPSDHRWLSFIKGETYLVKELRWDTEPEETGHNSVEGYFKRSDGVIVYGITPMSREDCKKHLKLI